jgi:hypothetical protein
MCRVFRIVSDRPTELLPLLTLGGIAMCIGGTSYVYLIVSIHPIQGASTKTLYPNIFFNYQLR